MTDGTTKSFGQKAINAIKHELWELIPTALFFLVGFNIIVLSQHLVLQEHGIVYVGVSKAVVAALIITKVVILADKIPFVRRFEESRPIVVITYKTLVYSALSFIARLVEELIENMIHLGSFGAAIEEGRSEFVWQHYASVHLWVLVLFAIYFTIVELGKLIGSEPVWKLLAHRGKFKP